MSSSADDDRLLAGMAAGDVIPVGTAKTRIRTGLGHMRATLEVDTRRG